MKTEFVSVAFCLLPSLVHCCKSHLFFFSPFEVANKGDSGSRMKLGATNVFRPVLALTTRLADGLKLVESRIWAESFYKVEY